MFGLWKNSVCLVLSLFLVMSVEHRGFGSTRCIKGMVSEVNDSIDQENDKKSIALQVWQIFVCPFKVIVSFLFFVLCIIMFVIVMLADLFTFFTNALTESFLKWAEEKFEEIGTFFNEIGCGGFDG